MPCPKRESRFANVILGTVELVVCAPCAKIGGVFTGAMLNIGAMVTETPVVVIIRIAYVGICLSVDGMNRVSDNKLQIDIGWLQWPF